MVKKISLRATLAQMKAGDCITIPLQVRGYNTIRNCASLAGSDLGRKYSVSLDRANNNCKVTRTA